MVYDNSYDLSGPRDATIANYDAASLRSFTALIKAGAVISNTRWKYINILTGYSSMWRWSVQGSFVRADDAKINVKQQRFWMA